MLATTNMGLMLTSAYNYLSKADQESESWKNTQSDFYYPLSTTNLNFSKEIKQLKEKFLPNAEANIKHIYKRDLRWDFLQLKTN